MPRREEHTLALRARAREPLPHRRARVDDRGRARSPRRRTVPRDRSATRRRPPPGRGCRRSRRVRAAPRARRACRGRRRAASGCSPGRCRADGSRSRRPRPPRAPASSSSRVHGRGRPPLVERGQAADVGFDNVHGCRAYGSRRATEGRGRRGHGRVGGHRGGDRGGASPDAALAWCWPPAAARRSGRWRSGSSAPAGGRWGSPCDVTDPHDLRTLPRVVEEAFGPIDVLVNNAGIPGGGSFASWSTRRSVGWWTSTSWACSSARGCSCPG